MKYLLSIRRQEGGDVTEICEEASGKIYGGILVLHYLFDGAEYSLEMGGGEMAQKRFGAVAMSMRFIEGRTTTASFGDGVNGGEFPLFTKNLNIKFDGADCKAECEFSYGGGDTVILTVVASAEQ